MPSSLPPSPQPFPMASPRAPSPRQRHAPPCCCATWAHPTRPPRRRCAATWLNSSATRGWSRSRAAVVADPARHHPARAAGQVGAQVRQHLDARRLAAGGLDRAQAKLLRGYLGERGHRVTVRYAMRYGNPSIASVLDALKAQGATRVLVLPLYPQYSGPTTASVVDAVGAVGAAGSHPAGIALRQPLPRRRRATSTRWPRASPTIGKRTAGPTSW